MDDAVKAAVEKVRDDVSTFMNPEPAEEDFWEFALSMANLESNLVQLVAPGKQELKLEELQDIWCETFLPKEKKEAIMSAQTPPLAESLGLNNYDNESIAAYWKRNHSRAKQSECTTTPHYPDLPDVTSTTTNNTTTNIHQLPPKEQILESVKKIQEAAQLEREKKEAEKKQLANDKEQDRLQKEQERLNKVPISKSHILAPPAINPDRKRPEPEPDTGPEACRRAAKQARLDRVELESGPGSVSAEIPSDQELEAIDVMTREYGPKDDYELWLKRFDADTRVTYPVTDILTEHQLSLIQHNIPRVEYIGINDVLPMLHKTMEKHAPILNSAWDAIRLLHRLGKIKLSPGEVILMELARSIHENGYNLSGGFNDPSFITLGWTTAMINKGVCPASLGCPQSGNISDYLTRMAQVGAQFIRQHPHLFQEFSQTEALFFLEIAYFYLKRAPRNISKLTPEVKQFMRNFAEAIVWSDDFKQGSQTRTYSGSRLEKPSSSFLYTNPVTREAMKQECLLRVRMMLNKVIPIIFPTNVQHPAKVRNMISMWSALERCIDTIMEIDNSYIQT
eukprot:CAMPEP_0171524468 /NCGR_PEP_ID=MMETSP0959-20130129/9081_1 /TAXON_ID=87120 /ORGANISM="Aurantiochytrium limacinum, Strain ATCCMYA-1381" /LENGTH=564 /DNA_ID=CAMNT_0012065237 /DNA_START=273 /DNA_END=1967 /DNA_ORIENTATION=+